MKIIGSGSKDDVQVILKVRDAAVAAVAQGDLDAYVNHMTDDAIVMPPGEEAVCGRAAIREWMRNALRDSWIKVECNSEELIISGDWAIDRHTFVQEVTPKDGGAPMHIEGKAVGVYRKNADGIWRAYIDCFNSNRE